MRAAARVCPALVLAWLPAATGGCRDLSGFSTHGDHYEGSVVAADFVRVGIDASTRACLTLDTDHLEDGPGALSTSDGRFGAVPLRPIPQIWHDPLSTLSFGEGRVKNLIYVATASEPFGDGRSDDAFVVLSLMQAGDVEVRLLRGAPPLADAGPPAGAASNIFALFDLVRQSGSCSY